MVGLLQQRVQSQTILNHKIRLHRSEGVFNKIDQKKKEELNYRQCYNHIWHQIVITGAILDHNYY